MYWSFFLGNDDYKNKLADLVSLFNIIELLHQKLLAAEIKSNPDALRIEHGLQRTLARVDELFTKLMDCGYIRLDAHITCTFCADSHQKLYNMMAIAASVDLALTKQMMLQACEKHPHFLNDIPYKLIPDVIKHDEDFIEQVHQQQQKCLELSKTYLAKNISNTQHYALWQLQNVIEKKHDISTALEAYLRSLGSGKPNDLAEVVELIKQKLRFDDSKQHIDSCFLKLVFKYPKILNQLENLPTDVFCDPQQQDILQQHYYSQLAKYTIGMSLGAGFAIAGILALADVLMFPYSISVVALVFGMIMLGTFIWSLKQDDFCDVMANHPFEAAPIKEPNKVVYGFPNAPSV